MAIQDLVKIIAGEDSSAAFAWTASNENFLKNSKTINNLKWRVSYGQSGSSGVRNDNSRRELNVAYYNYGETDVTGYENTVNVDPSLTGNDQHNLTLESMLLCLVIE